MCVCVCVFLIQTEISVESKNPTLQGLAFPLQEEAKHALQQLKHKRINYIQLVSPTHIHYTHMYLLHMYYM